MIDELEQLRPQPDKAILVCYSQAIQACNNAKQWQRAVQLLEGMEAGSGMAPNEFHYSGAVRCG